MQAHTGVSALAVLMALPGRIAAGVADFPPLSETVAWLRTERLRGTLFHDPAVQPVFRRCMVRPATAPGQTAPPVEVVGET